jgi:AcrR family transcriptional regulator
MIEKVISSAPAAGRGGEPASCETGQRLLDAAGAVFAERGFHAATTREICARAGANIAAINYHFGDKERLYEAVLRSAHRHAADHYPLAAAVPPAHRPAPRERLASFVAWYLTRVLGEERPAWQWKLMLREMQEPTPALQALIEKEFNPLADLESLCREIMGPGTFAAARLAARSVVGQCFFYGNLKPFLARLHPEERYHPADIRRLARSITAFSLGGMERLSGPRGEAPPPDHHQEKSRRP